MQKVALCMRGAISKNNMSFEYQDSIYNNGEYVDYNICYNSIIEHIIKPNKKDYEFNIFCHCWNPELEDQILKLYKPINYKFEDNKIYNSYIF